MLGLWLVTLQVLTAEWLGSILEGLGDTARHTDLFGETMQGHQPYNAKEYPTAHTLDGPGLSDKAATLAGQRDRTKQSLIYQFRMKPFLKMRHMCQ